MNKSVANIETSWTIVATFQVYENYAFDDDGNALTGNQAYWKAKGGEVVVIGESMTTNEVVNTDCQAVVDAFLVSDKAPKCDDYYRHSFLDWRLVERSTRVLQEAYDYISFRVDEYNSCDYWDVVYSAYYENDLLSEDVMKWAFAVLEEQGLLSGDHMANPDAPLVQVRWTPDSQ